MIGWALPELEPFVLGDDAQPAELQYAELALDPSSWDVAYPLVILRGADAVIQRVKVRFKFFKGEWFLDQRLGVPYYRDVLVKNPDTLVISRIFRQVLLSTPGVNRVDTFTAVLDRAARKLTCNFVAYLDDGTQVVAQDEPFIISGSG